MNQVLLGKQTRLLFQTGKNMVETNTNEIVAETINVVGDNNRGSRKGGNYWNSAKLIEKQNMINFN